MGRNRSSDWLSVADLAELLGVPVATVYDWNYKGITPPRVKIGRHVRYRRSAVEDWLGRHEVRTGQDGAA